MEFFEKLETQYRIKLTEQQESAVLAVEGKNLLLACPGSGKTTVMVVKTAYMIEEKKIDPENILSLTFSVSAARDMEKRYETLFGDTLRKPKFATIHSFCYKLMQIYFSREKINAENIEGENEHKLSKLSLLGRIYETVNSERGTEETIEKCSGEISYIKNLLIHPDDFDTYNFETPNMKEIYKVYAEQKLKLNLYDFDDMLLIAYRALKQYPDILTDLQQKYHYIQIDEAQDNSKVQNQIIQLLVTEHNNLFMVADDDQTIYEWRGAYPEGILKFESLYPGATVFRMEENFRSSQDIVETANIFIKKNKIRYEKNILTKNPAFKPINVIKVKTETDQIKSVIEMIKKSKGHFREHALLYRNNMTAVLFAQQLLNEKIPFQIRGSKPFFFGHWVVEDIKNYLLLSLYPDQVNYLETIFYRNDCFISKAGFENAKKKAGTIPIFDAIIQFSNLKDFQKTKVYQLKWSVEQLKNKSVKDAISSIALDIGYLKWIEGSGKKKGVSVDFVSKMISTLKILATDTADIMSFFAKLDLLQQNIEVASKQRGDYVNLTTIHSAKGLEFDHVYMVDLVDGVFPSFEALLAHEKGLDQLLEAERRLFYVGKTRARLYLNLFEMDQFHGIKMEPSVFLQEVKEILFPHMQKHQVRKRANLKQKAEKKAAQSRPENYFQTTIDSAKQTTALDNPYHEGQKIYHLAFGSGEIKYISPTLIHVNFESGENKKFDLNTVIRSKLLGSTQE